MVRVVKMLRVYGKKVAGVVLIIVGFVGLFLPFLQGIAMIVAGLALLGNDTLLKKIKAFERALLRKNKKK